MTTTAAPGAGIAADEQALAVALRKHGRAAVPGLVRLLTSDDEDVRALAAYVLRDMDCLTDAEVAGLAAALRLGEEWGAPALARIGSPAAIAALVARLRASPGHHNQVTFAFRQLGARGIPALLGLFDCRGACEQAALFEAVAYIFERSPRRRSRPSPL